ncbi:endo-1,4-beta-xylanase [Segatella copri]|uniref:Beta-xylanase n=1 Tax=Segatella copri TaxID=165179 RepID=A0AAW5IPX0_9BACT|nr:endo-1,4-beta-xylanase [Segatella copri]MCP9552187.1 endo-1,4-beta-xylanase [Segatella copri]MCP9572786.1 endo-1,4-beta-xylanase [Segatella copri]MCP9575964.1 endo-1,4-beta-xylanase [Segatella copri]MCP9578821.1 endo-1,4-beta-xylanase [Segatella copri]MCP9581856.1 endo-1,4-beta-xylanase [Segatella copri]
MNKQILVSALGAMLLASCADHFDQNFETVRPDKEAQYGYLEQYDALKEYIKDRPNFHLGIGTTVDEYNKKELVYALTNSNFNETVAGNAMKMASCVADDGSMNFDKVSEYVKNATDAGLSVYGHTLAWHAQQPNKYLNQLIADKELPPSSNVTRCLVIKNAEAGGHWDAQLYFPAQLSQGKKYVFKMNAKATAPFELILWGAPGDAGLGSISVGTKWNEYTVNFTPAANYENFVFAAGKLGGELDIKSLSLCEEGSTNNLIVNGDIKGDEVPCNKPYSWHKVTTEIKEVAESQVVEIPVSVGHLTFDDGKNLGGWGMDNAPKIVNGVYEVGNNAAKKNPWDAQVNYEPGFAFENGTTYHLKMKIKGSVAGEFGAVFQNPDGYKGCGDFPTINVTTDWNEVDVATLCNGDNALRLLLNIGKYAGTLYIDDFEVYYTKSSNTIPLTDEEKKEALTPVLQNWIYGMMEATEGKVKAWDVVNEAISGKDGSEFYPLQSATRGTVSADDAKNNFYWQDYLGDLDYVRTAVAAARKGFADAGGNPDELKLFINDYNLETAYDQNKKLKSLIHWIEEWEKDGKTKIDGIGSQMHVTYNMDPAKQKENEEAYVNMLHLMVDSHKLVRISELDMGLEDKDGNLVNTTDMTEEQHEKMRAYYEFIVKKYLEIVPENQQWGICQWCATDSPANSGWRAGSPVGLWDLDYYRKHTYGGFAAGLGAPEYWNNAK